MTSVINRAFRLQMGSALGKHLGCLQPGHPFPLSTVFTHLCFTLEAFSWISAVGGHYFLSRKEFVIHLWGSFLSYFLYT